MAKSKVPTPDKKDDAGAVKRLPNADARNSRTTVSGPASPGPGPVEQDDLAAKAAGTQELASKMPFNRGKADEYDPARATAPKPGQSEKPDDPIVGASTVTEAQGSDKVGSGSPTIGTNSTIGPLDRVRVDSTDRVLTTNQGVPIGDNQNSLKAGLRGPTLLEDFILREKITHFDHERIPERIVHARGSAAHGYFECTTPLGDYHARGHLFRGGEADPGLRPLLDRARRARLDRHRTRRPRVRGEVLHRGRQLGSRGEQHPHLLHPGRDEVPGPRARRQARASFRACRRRGQRTIRSGTSPRSCPRSQRCSCGRCPIAPSRGATGRCRGSACIRTGW